MSGLIVAHVTTWILSTAIYSASTHAKLFISCIVILTCL